MANQERGVPVSFSISAVGRRVGSHIEAEEFHAFKAKTPPPGNGPVLEQGEGEEEEEERVSNAIETVAQATGK